MACWSQVYTTQPYYFYSKIYKKIDYLKNWKFLTEIALSNFCCGSSTLHYYAIMSMSVWFLAVIATHSSPCFIPFYDLKKMDIAAGFIYGSWIPICLGKGSSFGLLCAFIVKVYQFMCAFHFDGRMWDFIILVPAHCLSYYFVIRGLAPETEKWHLKEKNNRSFDQFTLGPSIISLNCVCFYI